jgi:trans-aconitate 2-methyltransferase
MTPQTTWNSTLYEDAHAFVWQYGESLLDFLAPQSDETILDLGCGTGHLTAKIASAGATVWGIDADANMIQQARQNHPQLRFEVADARNFQVDETVDAVFSNAVLHWIREPDAVLSCIYRALKPGGRFVAELGGQGNIQAIAQALLTALQQLGEDPSTIQLPWYFPSIGDYATRLEHQGFEVRYATLFDRPTALDGPSGLANWLQMFANSLLKGRSLQEQQQIIHLVETQLQPTLFRDHQWWADYRRLRIVAIRT